MTLSVVRTVVPIRKTGTTPAEVLDFVVSQRHIEGGERDSKINCAVALALKEIGYSRVSVHSGRLGVLADEVWYDHTPESQAWVKAFDLGTGVHPERFRLQRRRYDDAA